MHKVDSRSNFFFQHATKFHTQPNPKLRRRLTMHNIMLR